MPRKKTNGWPRDLLAPHLKELRERYSITVPLVARWTTEERGKIPKLHEVEGLTIRQISDVMRCSTSTVQEVLKRSKLEAKKQIETQPGFDLSDLGDK